MSPRCSTPCGSCWETIFLNPLPRRAVLVMHEIDGVLVHEVAATLGIPRFTVYARLRKARQELESVLRG